MPESSYTFQTVTRERRLEIIVERLRAYEEELANAQINLAVETAAVEATGGDPATNYAVINHQASVDMTIARLNALAALSTEIQNEPTP